MFALFFASRFPCLSIDPLILSINLFTHKHNHSLISAMAPGAGGDTPGAKVETGSIKWQRDDEVPTCENCNIEFSFTVRRHHCRACGRIFCATCSSEKLDIVNYNTPQRVCFTCYSRYCDLRPDEKSACFASELTRG